MRSPAVLALPALLAALFVVADTAAQRGRGGGGLGGGGRGFGGGGRGAVNVGGSPAPPPGPSGAGRSSSNPAPRSSTQPQPPASSAVGVGKSRSAPAGTRPPNASQTRGTLRTRNTNPRPGPVPGGGQKPVPGRRPVVTPLNRLNGRRGGTPIYTSASAITPVVRTSAVRVLDPVALTLDSITADPEEKRVARAAAKEFRRSEISGGAVARSVSKLKRLEWNKSMERAVRQARAENKPIVWIQTLGDLTGFLGSAGQSLRGVTLSDPAVFATLQRDFVLGWADTRREDFAGDSGDSNGYSPHQACVGTTNGAGAASVQTFVLSPDLVVLHALPGFWHPEDYLAELEFGRVIWRLWQDEGRTREQKEDMFRRLQLTELRFQEPVMYARSDWQGNGASAPVLEPINVLVHDRMSKRPFVRFEDFDTAAFVDYGR